jgi:hypothetical protein
MLIVVPGLVQSKLHRANAFEITSGDTKCVSRGVAEAFQAQVSTQNRLKEGKGMGI